MCTLPDWKGWRTATLARAVPMDYDRCMIRMAYQLAEGTHDGST